MSLLNKQLAGVKPGTTIRLSQMDGQILEGVVLENDGEDSLSLQIRSVVTLRYAAVASFVSSGQASPESAPSQNSTASVPSKQTNSAEEKTIPTSQSAQTGLAPASPMTGTETTKIKKTKLKSVLEIPKISTTKIIMKQVFGELSGAEKKAFQSAYNKYQNSEQTKDKDKLREAIQLTWDSMCDHGWESSSQSANRFYAYLTLADEEYTLASESFYYATSLTNAFLVAFRGAEREKENLDLRNTAAAFACIFLVQAKEDEQEFVPFAYEVIRISANACQDVSFVSYLKEYGTSEQKQALAAFLSDFCAASGIHPEHPDSIDDCVTALKPWYKNTGILTSIDRYLGNNESEEESVELSDRTGTNKEIEQQPTGRTFIKIFDGSIILYNPVDEIGTIKTTGGNEYQFVLSSVEDDVILSRLRQYGDRSFAPIPVLFQLQETDNVSRAVSIQKGRAQLPADSESAEERLTRFRKLMGAQQFEKALSVGEQMLAAEEWDDGFDCVITSILPLWKRNEGDGWDRKAESYLNQCLPHITRNSKNLDHLNVLYGKLNQHDKKVQILTELIDLTPSSDTNHLLTYIWAQAKSYRELGDIPAAISGLKRWISIEEKNRSVQLEKQKKEGIYSDLAELFALNSDWTEAERYANLSTDTDRRQKVLNSIPKKSEEDSSEPKTSSAKAVSIDNTPAADDDPSDEDISFEDALKMYEQTEKIHPIVAEPELVEGINRFGRGQAYALTTWLNVSSQLIGKSEHAGRTSVFSPEFTCSEIAESLNLLFGYALRSPLVYIEDFAPELPGLYRIAKKAVPELADALFAAATLRAVFHHSDDVQYYQYADLLEVLSTSSVLEHFPPLRFSCEALQDFREKTGYGINLFSAYRSDEGMTEEYAREASECLEIITARLNTFENLPRLRRADDILFSDDTILMSCLRAVATNEKEKASEIRQKITEAFIRENREFDRDNIDVKRLDSMIDDVWDKALRKMKEEGHRADNPNDKLIGGKRNQLNNLLRRSIGAVCDWALAAEHSTQLGNPYTKEIFDSIVPQLTEQLNATAAVCENDLSENEWNWGTESVRLVCSELLDKLSGKWDRALQPYYYIDFLRGNDVTLGDDFLPDLYGTFCDLENFNLPTRILHHISSPLPSFEERLTDVFGDDETKNDLHSALLLAEYGKVVRLPVLSESKYLDSYAKCLAASGRRLELQYEDFVAEINLCEHRGAISDTAGDKTHILAVAEAWYHITKETENFGFYARLLEAYREKIRASSGETAQNLTRQLEDLEGDENYDFGVYQPERIRGYIEDQNFTVAENMLNSVRRHDAAAIRDYTEEPFDVLNGFIDEASVNHRIGADSAVSLEKSILKYAKKSNLEQAILHLTGNARKDVRGGTALIQNWISMNCGPDRIKRLLGQLGLSDCTVRQTGTDLYHAVAAVRRGKVSYPHPIPAFGSLAESDGFRVLCLFGRYDCERLLDKFREVNTVSLNTLVFLDYSLTLEERRRLARKIKEEKSFANTFAVIDRSVMIYLAKHYVQTSIARTAVAAVMPFAYYCPFVENSSAVMPPELFTGRVAELTSIEQPDGANLVYGGRQLGKSALLKMAQRHIDNNGNDDRAVYLDIREMDYVQAAKRVSQQLVDNGILSLSEITENWEALTRAIEKRMTDSKKPRINHLLLMLDEADRFIESCREIAYQPIDRLKNILPGRFKIVMAGLHNLSRFNRETMHGNSTLVHLKSVVIKPFERQEAIQLLTYTLGYLGFRFQDEGVISMILAKTNYFPGLLQLYCEKLLEAMRSSDYAGYGEFNTPPYEISEAHMKKVLTNRDFADEIQKKLEMTLFVEEEGHSHYHAIALLLAYHMIDSSDPTGLTPDEVYQMAKDFGIPRLTALKEEQVAELMQEMWDLNILTARENVFSFASEGFRDLLGDKDAIEMKILEYGEEGGV